MQRGVIILEHDHLVRQKALEMVSQGYHVKARLEGWFEWPDVIYGYRPDIIAEKPGEIIIVEVKKGPIDWPKISAFQRFEKENPNCRVSVVPLAIRA